MPRRPRRRVDQEGDSAYVRDLRKKMPVHPRLDDVVASGDDPHPRKTRRIKWIGDYNPMRDARVMANLIRGAYNPHQVASIRRSAAFAKEPVDGLRSRLMEAKHERRGVAVVSHLNRTYHFTKLNDYTCHVDYRDVDILLREGNGTFIDLDDPNESGAGHVYVADEEVWKVISVEVMHRGQDEVPNRFRAASGPR